MLNLFLNQYTGGTRLRLRHPLRRWLHCLCNTDHRQHTVYQYRDHSRWGIEGTSLTCPVLKHQSATRRRVQIPRSHSPQWRRRRWRVMLVQIQTQPHHHRQPRCSSILRRHIRTRLQPCRIRQCHRRPFRPHLGRRWCRYTCPVGNRLHQ